MSDSPTTALPFWHVMTDSSGTSRQVRRLLKGFEAQSMGGDADPQSNLPFEGARKVIFAELPAGFDGDWHENPAPQWIVPLSGGWWVETMDGRRVEMRAGDLSFGADLRTTGAKGHRSGTLDDAPCRLMIVQMDAVPREVTDAPLA